MTTKARGRLSEVLDEIEALARRLRTYMRRAARDMGVTKNLEQAAAALRKQAALVAAQVERYVHDLRLELAKGAPKRRPFARARRAA